MRVFFIAASDTAYAEPDAILSLATLATRRTTITTAFTAWRAAFHYFFRLTFGTRDFEASILIDDLHRQLGLAAIIEAEQFHPNFLAFLDHFVWMVRAHLGG